MKDIDEIRRDNLRLIERELGGPTVAAKAIGMSPAQFANLRDGAKDSETGKPRGMRKETARRIEEKCSKPENWLDAPHDIANIEPALERSDRVPIISWVQAGEFCEAHVPWHADEWVETSVQVLSNTFALRVKGDSMEPEFPAGVIIVVEPDMGPNPGDFVVVRNGGGEATFKQLVRDGQDWYMKPINPRYPIKPLGESHVVGVVREMVKKFR